MERPWALLQELLYEEEKGLVSKGLVGRGVHPPKVIWTKAVWMGPEGGLLNVKWDLGAKGWTEFLRIETEFEL
jgi:hypothetical protein